MCAVHTVSLSQSRAIVLHTSEDTRDTVLLCCGDALAKEVWRSGSLSPKAGTRQLDVQA